MKRISGGQLSRKAKATLLSSHAGDPRAATGDRSFAGQARAVDAAVESQPAASPRTYRSGRTSPPRRQTTLTVTGVSAQARRASASDDEQAQQGRLLLPGNGAVLAHHLACPLAAESDESRPWRGQQDRPEHRCRVKADAIARTGSEAAACTRSTSSSTIVRRRRGAARGAAGPARRALRQTRATSRRNGRCRERLAGASALVATR